MPYGIEPTVVRYDDAKEYILDADVLFYHGLGPVSTAVIRTATLSEYAHVGMAGWTNGESKYKELMAYEMLWTGGQGHVLSSHVDTRKGVHVYRCSDSFTSYRWDSRTRKVHGETRVLDRKAAVHQMRKFCRPDEYGKMHLFWTACTRMPFVRWVWKQPTNDEIADRKRPPYCSEAVAFALRHAFTDIVRNTPDHYTSPGALARSPLLHYMFTLVP